MEDMICASGIIITDYVKKASGVCNMFDMADVKTVVDKVNKRYDGLFWKDRDGKQHVYVCSFCDEFIKNTRDLHTVSMDVLRKKRPDGPVCEMLKWKNMPDVRRTPELEEYYRFPLSEQAKLPGCTNFLNEMALSPKGNAFRMESAEDRKKIGISSCSTCYNALTHKRRPFHAIINRNYVGGAPSCLQELNDVELALLTPIKNHGYCFTFVGGKQKLLKGTLTFMRVEKRSIANSVTTLESMGFTKNILVIYSGALTRDQKARVAEKSTIRTDYVIRALEWLCVNHVEWKEIDLKGMKEKLHNHDVTVVDHSEEVEGLDSNLEKEEAFSCFYPDGAVTPENGGFDDPNAFKQYVSDMASAGFDVEFQMDLHKKYVQANDADIMVNSGLLQFPYGIGGMDDARVNSDNGENCKTDVQDYLRHLSNLSQPVFHTAMFQLVMYSVISKSRLLKKSRFKLKTPADATSIANGMNPQDLHETIRQRTNGNRYAGTRGCRTLLDAVDACAQSLPHTNEASKKARGVGESMQHHFGMGSIFLTATFDDENSLLMQAMAEEWIDNDTKVMDLTAAECASRAKARQKLRIKYPGLASLNYQMLLDILVECIVGWDMRLDCPTKEKGAYGEVEAFRLATEEQGRKTLHGHMIIYIKKYKEMYDKMFDGSTTEKEKAKRAISAFYDAMSDTSLFPVKTNELRKYFDHENCKMPKRERPIPLTVDNQSLRNLRHKHGYQATDGIFATCPSCTKTWTYEDMVSDMTSSLICPPVGIEITATNHNNDQRSSKRRKVGDSIPRDRMRCAIVEYQKTGVTYEDAPARLINAACNSHLSCHVSGCFKCNKKRKRDHICGPKCECRFRLPDIRRSNTTVRYLHDGIDWYSWNGTKTERPIVQIQPKRNQYDLFQNVSAKAVTLSKFSCNSNIQVMTEGPSGQYIHKYNDKKNAEEETKEYGAVEHDMKKIDCRRHEDDRSEATRRIVRAAFAHNKTNIISPAFGHYLIQHDSRFYTSHSYCFIPLKDVMKVHDSQEIECKVNLTSSGRSYFENMALHYLCRPDFVQELSLIEFFEKYEVKTVPKKTEKRKAVKKDCTKRKKGKKVKVPVEVTPFLSNTLHFKHPSAVDVTVEGKTVRQCLQGVAEREDFVLGKVTQWSFPDTADFKCEITTCSLAEMNASTESYARHVLTLFLPHRSKSETMITDGLPFPYTRKLQLIYREEENHICSRRVFTERNKNFLQNLQNCRKNSLRYKVNGDELAECTDPFDCNEFNGTEAPSDELDKEQEPEVLIDYESVLDAMSTGDDVDAATDHDPDQLRNKLQNFDLLPIRKRGVLDSGMAEDLPVPTISEEDCVDFVSHGWSSSSTIPNKGVPGAPGERYKRDVEDIAKLLLRRRTPAILKKVFTDKSIKVSEANGSIESIRQWSKAACGTDRRQQRAFEVILASFLLTFYTDAEELNDISPAATSEERIRFVVERMKLRRLQGLRGTDQLVCLLHGAGGSGKTTVINAVKAYAKEFCERLNHPFNARTIVVTAMSGVAATLLHGETTHSVLGLNRDRVKGQEIDDFADARLLIIDEISFASPKDICKMYTQLQQLKQVKYGHFGGMNVVFSGDYSQLEPVNDVTVYAGDVLPEYHYVLNCFIELEGTWRFKDDPNWGQLLRRFRDGTATEEDIRYINTTCDIKNKPIPEGIQVATYANKDRDAVNCSIFERYCAANEQPKERPLFYGAIAIFMDSIEMKNSRDVFVNVRSNRVKRHFYQKCGESSINMDKGRCDSMLKLYPGCPLMYTKNSDVSKGEANGSRVRLRSVVVKPEEQPFVLKLRCGTYIRSYYASQISHLTVEHEQEDITPRVFNVTSQRATFKSKLNMGYEEVIAKMKGIQFPVVSNSCTTGHKLQGCTVPSLLVNHFHYSRNWPYVVLSRIRTIKGLYLRDLLSTNMSKYAISKAMTGMIDEFRRLIPVTELTDEDYSVIMNLNVSDVPLNEMTALYS